MEVPGWTGLDKVFARFPTRIVESRDRRTNALWNILSEAGWSTGFANWWASFPAEIVNGYVVSDHFAFALRPYRERGFEYIKDGPGRVYPDSLMGRLIPLLARPEDLAEADLERFFRADPGDLEAVRSIADWEKPTDGATGATVQPNEFYLGAFLLPYLEDVSATRRTIALETEYEPDLLGFYVRGIDDIEHHFWHFREPGAFPAGSIPKEQLEKFGGLIEAYYAFTDSLLGEVIRSLDSETTILVVSDHGQVASGRIPWSGTHFLDDAPPGIFVAAGPGIRHGESVAGASVYDIAPTILHALGFPTAEDQRGRALTEIFTPEFEAATPKRTIPSYDRWFHSWKIAALAAEGIDDLDEQMQERLRALGYVK
jgi:arylsulfatase A-like enzyme